MTEKTPLLVRLLIPAVACAMWPAMAAFFGFLPPAVYLWAYATAWILSLLLEIYAWLPKNHLIARRLEVNAAAASCLILMLIGLAGLPPKYNGIVMGCITVEMTLLSFWINRPQQQA